MLFKRHLATFDFYRALYLSLRVWLNDCDNIFVVFYVLFNHFSSKDETQANSRASPTLNDLESRKQQLLAELDTNTTSDSSKSCDPDIKESSAAVKTSSFGTPILKSASPYAKLPKPDNFSQNISPVINFENLPNATGKYDQMTGILQKVRTSLKGLQGERKT